MPKKPGSSEGRRWWCRKCGRTLMNGLDRDGLSAPENRDSVTATKGGTKITHDQCGGSVARSKRKR